jgi:hypothetical protein
MLWPIYRKPGSFEPFVELDPYMLFVLVLWLSGDATLGVVVNELGVYC